MLPVAARSIGVQSDREPRCKPTGQTGAGTWELAARCADMHTVLVWQRGRYSIPGRRTYRKLVARPTQGCKITMKFCILGKDWG